MKLYLSATRPQPGPGLKGGQRASTPQLTCLVPQSTGLLFWRQRFLCLISSFAPPPLSRLLYRRLWPHHSFFNASLLSRSSIRGGVQLEQGWAIISYEERKSRIWKNFEKFWNQGPHVRRCPIFHPNASEEQKKSHRVRRCPIFHPNASEEQKKKSSRPQMPNFPPTWKWKAKKKVRVRRCPIFHPHESEKLKKRSSRPQMFFFSLTFSASSAWFTLGVYISISAGGLHKMVWRAALYPLPS